MFGRHEGYWERERARSIKARGHGGCAGVVLIVASALTILIGALA